MLLPGFGNGYRAPIGEYHCGYQHDTDMDNDPQVSVVVQPEVRHTIVSYGYDNDRVSPTTSPAVAG